MFYKILVLRITIATIKFGLEKRPTSRYWKDYSFVKVSPNLWIVLRVPVDIWDSDCIWKFIFLCAAIWFMSNKYCYLEFLVGGKFNLLSWYLQNSCRKQLLPTDTPFWYLLGDLLLRRVLVPERKWVRKNYIVLWKIKERPKWAMLALWCGVNKWHNL